MNTTTIRERKALASRRETRPTADDLRDLERLERQRWEQFHFLRESPKDQADIPFAEYAPRVSWKTTVVSLIVIIAVVVLTAGVAL